MTAFEALAKTLRAELEAIASQRPRTPLSSDHIPAFDRDLMTISRTCRILRLTPEQLAAQAEAAGITVAGDLNEAVKTSCAGRAIRLADRLVELVKGRDGGLQ